MGHERKIENRYSHDLEFAVVDLGVAIHIHVDTPSAKLPFWMRQFTGGYRSMAHQITVRSKLLNDFSGKSKWIVCWKHETGAMRFKAYGSNRTVENPFFGVDVVRAVTSLDMLIVRAAIQQYVAF